jgi:hypothetical protein
MILVGLGRLYVWEAGLFRFRPLPFDVKYCVRFRANLLALDYDGCLWLIARSSTSQVSVPKLSRLCNWTGLGLLCLTMSGEIAHLTTVSESPTSTIAKSGELRLVHVPTPTHLVDVSIVKNYYLGLTLDHQVIQWPVSGKPQTLKIASNVISAYFNSQGCLMLSSNGVVSFYKVRACYVVDLNSIIKIKLVGLTAYLLDTGSRIWMWHIQSSSRPRIIAKIDIYNWEPFWENDGAPSIVSTLSGQFVSLSSNGDCNDILIN